MMKGGHREYLELGKDSVVSKDFDTLIFGCRKDFLTIGTFKFENRDRYREPTVYKSFHQ